jgi:hypothetical protein
MAEFKKGNFGKVSQSHHEYGREWIGKIGRIHKVARNILSLDMGDCVIHVPKSKVVSA